MVWLRMREEGEGKREEGEKEISSLLPLPFSLLNQVQQREQENPDQIDEMPVQPHHLRFAGDVAFAAEIRQAQNRNHARENMHAVDERQRPVECKEEVVVGQQSVMDFVVVLVA